MKYILPLLLLSHLYCFSQVNDSTTNKTKLGGLNIKTGAIIKKEYTDLAKFGAYVNDLEFKILKTTDAASGLTIKGLYVSYYNEGQHTGYIDSDEIHGLIKFLDFIIQSSNQDPDLGGKEIEYVYNCLDLKFAMFNAKPEYGFKSKRVYSWNYIVKIDFFASSRYEFKLKDIQDLKGKLEANISEFQ